MINQHKKVQFGSIRAFRVFRKSTVTPVIISKVYYRIVYEDFEIIFRIPIILSANHHNSEAQPPLAVAKLNSNFHLFFLFNYYLYLFIFIKFNYFYYYDNNITIIILFWFYLFLISFVYLICIVFILILFLIHFICFICSAFVLSLQIRPTREPPFAGHQPHSTTTDTTFSLLSSPPPLPTPLTSSSTMPT